MRASRRMGQWFAIVAFFVAAPTFACAQALQPGKTWTNLHGSTLLIQSVSPDGSFTGIFTNQTKGFACKGIPYPATGWQDDVIVSFSVRFDNGTPQGNCRAVTSWVGYVETNRMEAYWEQFYMKGPNAPTRLHGRDSFR